jgi:hypothetical protein
LEREYLAGLSAKLYSPPPGVAILATAAITLSYPLITLAAIAGIYLVPPVDRRAHLLLMLVIGFICGIHMVAFGHSRYHLPLMPILMLYAAEAWAAGKWRFLWNRCAVPAAPLATAAVLVGFWVRQILVVDSSRIAELFRSLG